jgi:Relaxase/Mobilisation nuclease domain
MIARIHKSASQARLIDYLLQANKQAQIVDASLFTPNINSLISYQKVITNSDNEQVTEELNKAFNRINGLKPGLKNNTMHLIIAFDPSDGELLPEFKGQIARDLLDRMGYSNTYWMAINHHRDDPEHDHVHDHDHLHILAARVDTNGRTISDSHDYPIVSGHLRQIEQDYKLTPFVPFWEREHATPEIEWILYPEVEPHPEQTKQRALSPST